MDLNVLINAALMIIKLFLTKKGLHLKSEALKLDGITNEQT